MKCSTRQDATASVGDHEVPAAASATSLQQARDRIILSLGIGQFVGDQSERRCTGERRVLESCLTVGASGAGP